MNQSVMQKSQDLQRAMKSRHVTMLAIGGTIGTGLFLGPGYVLQKEGPGGSLIAYGWGDLIASAGIVTSFLSADTVYLFLISSIGASNMFLYAITCLCQNNFRKVYLKEGDNINKLKFKAPLYPVLPILGIILYTILVIIMIFEPTHRIALYSALPIFAVLYLIYRIKVRT